MNPETKEIVIGGKTFYIHKAPATIGYEVALRYQAAKNNTDPDTAVKDIQKSLYTLLKYVEVDLGDGRLAALDSQAMIDQHITNIKDLIELQKETVGFNFGFLAQGAA